MHSQAREYLGAGHQPFPAVIRNQEADEGHLAPRHFGFSASSPRSHMRSNWRRPPARAQAAPFIPQKVRRAVSCMVRAVAVVSWPKLAEPRVVINVPKLV